MGMVYVAEQTSLGRLVAVKVLPPEACRDPRYVARFQREARLAASLNHPAIVQIYDVGEADGWYFFSMELIDAADLSEYIRRNGPLSVKDSLRLMKEIAGALECAYAAGIVHRDIKPSNMLITKSGQAKLVDLGLAKSSAMATALTQARDVMGTPDFMAPEQAYSTRDVDIRADIYSLGITWYYALVGRPPFPDLPALEVITRHQKTPLPPITEGRRDVPEAVSDVIYRMTEKQPADRYANPTELLQALERCERGLQPDAVSMRVSPPVAPAEAARPRTRRTRRKTAGPGLALWLSGCAAVAVVLGLLSVLLDKGSENEEGSTRVPVSARHEPRTSTGEMVLVPTGTLHCGAWDDSVTVRLLRQYGLDSGDALKEILETPPRTVSIADFYIDEHEVTNAEYALFLARASSTRRYDHPQQPQGQDHTPDEWEGVGVANANLPVTGVDWYDAYAYAKWAGKSLPTEDQWELAARGTDGRVYPWGNDYKDELYSVASGPVSVGVLPHRNPAGCVGMASNVAEWTATPGRDSGLVTFRGGAWCHNPGEVYAVAFLRCFAPVAYRGEEMGFRCVKTADGGPPPEAMQKVKGGRVALGGEDTPLLRAMRAHLDIVTNLDEAFLSDEPHVVEMKSFHIDRYEVTNAQYRRFLADTTACREHRFCHREEPPDKDHTPDGWDEIDPEDDDLPVVGVDWYDAWAYARWAGKRLPTANEWERAARGGTKRLYPWGDMFQAGKCVCAESDVGGPQPVGSATSDISPAGVSDMGGNVMEWTADDITHGDSEGKLLRGAAWDVSGRLYSIVHLRQWGADRSHRAANVGFRCVADAPTQQTSRGVP